MSKTIENRVRRKAARKGYRVHKSRLRHTHPDNDGDFMLIENRQNIPVLGWRFNASLSEIEAWLDDPGSTAIHEAGHAVIGRALGLTCGSATIVPNEAEGEAGHHIVARPDRIQYDWDKRGKYRESDSVFIGRILTFMAGAEAETELVGRCAGGDGDDRREIEWMADSIGLSDEQWERYEPRMRRHTRRLVRKHRSKIERVAGTLEERGTLQAQEIDLLMA